MYFTALVLYICLGLLCRRRQGIRPKRTLKPHPEELLLPRNWLQTCELAFAGGGSNLTPPLDRTPSNLDLNPSHFLLLLPPAPSFEFL